MENNSVTKEDLDEYLFLQDDSKWNFHITSKNIEK